MRMTQDTAVIEYSAEVAAARAEGRAIVALESTIIAHGMPYPQNVETARAVEAIIRDKGAVPATIAVIGGKLKAGLSAEELDRFGRDGPAIRKVSTRDLADVVAKGLDGATTVASTMRIAALAGIAVFATGGIGGVHRGAATSFDISADMGEFGQSNVAVVTAGAKAILDLALTLEMLETMGVPVVGFGCDEFPAFYSRDSGLAVPMRCDTAAEVAQMMKAKWAMGLAGGVVVANPIPGAFEIPAAEIAPWIDEALAAASAEGVRGKAVTPFLLARLAQKTGGRSLAANIALVRNNAAVAADIALAFRELAA
jgi:pseudouridylate synthase